MTHAQDLTPDTIVAFLADIFDRRGGEEYLGEPVTMAEHMLQGATLAERAGHTEHIVVAALLALAVAEFFVLFASANLMAVVVVVATTDVSIEMVIVFVFVVVFIFILVIIVLVVVF